MTNADRQKRYREKKRNAIDKNVTVGDKNVTPVTEAWYPNKPTDEKGKPITPVTLSDGQLWYPNYKKQKTTKGEPAGLVSALADPVRREKIERITNSLKNHGVLEGVRYGIGGPTFKTINEVTNSKP